MPVTCAVGFIGSHLVEMPLDRRQTVRAMIHYGCQPHLGNLDYLNKSKCNTLEVIADDVSDPLFMRSVVKGVDIVLDFAALICARAKVGGLRRLDNRKCVK